MEKVQAELAFVEKVHVLHLTSFYCLYSYRQHLPANHCAGVFTVIVKIIIQPISNQSCFVTILSI